MDLAVRSNAISNQQGFPLNDEEAANIIEIAINESAELVEGALAKAHQEIGQKLVDHIGKVKSIQNRDFQIHSFTHSEIIEFGGQYPKAPCLCLAGPSIKRTWGPMFNLTIDTGIDEMGHIKTKTYNKFNYYDLGYDLLPVAETIYQLLDISESIANFFQKFQGLTLIGRTYKVCEVLPVSPENTRNYTNTITARGEFKIENFLVIDPESFTDSGRIYNVKTNTRSVENESL